MRIPFALTLLVLAAAAAATALAGQGSPAAPDADVRGLEGVEFIAVCDFSHRAPDDPIVLPGRPDRSHDHTFVGNVSTNAFSTVESLRGAATSCQRSEDTAAYWAPTLFADGKPVEPAETAIYYRRRTLARVRAFPPGLVMIAGDAGATAPQSLRVTFWDCGRHANVLAASSPPACSGTGSSRLNLHVRFPDCWDGLRLDSDDHKRHMAYSLRGLCPRTHRVAVPSIDLVLEYPVAGGEDLELASGGIYSGHADFINAWRQAALERLVATCLNALRHCDRGA